MHGAFVIRPKDRALLAMRSKASSATAYTTSHWSWGTLLPPHLRRIFGAPVKIQHPDFSPLSFCQKAYPSPKKPVYDTRSLLASAISLAGDASNRNVEAAKVRPLIQLKSQLVSQRNVKETSTTRERRVRHFFVQNMTKRMKRQAVISACDFRVLYERSVPDLYGPSVDNPVRLNEVVVPAPACWRPVLTWCAGRIKTP
ncbi:hypothetical protein BDP55DRAFT_638667 [Colletotrichum godetiae]|uniref:Uncharacterized protein n=1 Tax=Colletotrichum godetiae TaxID=1209918 RepID=A0AAJ0AAI4_9PEZI|nr:uncharacterized protein BDP55DRAFT_638667 [Colletotrichum godetiae]KAK1657490.1 hypothetical protein BDP55DRAFT_638667 [Colletotrichum godetiae]